MNPQTAQEAQWQLVLGRQRLRQREKSLKYQRKEEKHHPEAHNRLGPIRLGEAAPVKYKSGAEKCKKGIQSKIGDQNKRWGIEDCDQFDQPSFASQQKMQEERQSYQQYIEERNRLIVEKRQTIGKMKETVKYYSHHPSQDLNPNIQELETKVRDQLKDIEDRQSVTRQTSSNVDVLISTNLLLSDKIDELNSKLYEIKIQKLSELADFEKNVVSLKGTLDKPVVRILGMKEEFQRLKNNNERLVSQRTQLVKRAAVGFSQLTPRPNIREEARLLFLKGVERLYQCPRARSSLHWHSQRPPQLPTNILAFVIQV